MALDDARVALFREHPPAWWGWPWSLPTPLTITELIAAGSLDPRVAGLLWVALERRASLLVAAGPNGAGKTVLLSALLAFLPPHVQRVHLRGMAETFDFLAHADPANTYLLCNELSDHLPIYLWGRPARRLFELLPQGFGLGATLHADSVEEVLAVLRAPPLAIPAALLAQVALVAVLAVRRQGAGLQRRLATLHCLDYTAGALVARPLAVWDQNRDTYHYEAEAHLGPLARRLGLAPGQLAQRAAARARFLAALVARGTLAPDGVRAALAAYRDRDAP